MLRRIKYTTYFSHLSSRRFIFRQIYDLASCASMNESSADCIVHLFIWRSTFRHSGSSTRWDQDRPRLLDSLRDNVFVWTHASVVTWSNHPYSAQRTVYCFEQQHHTYESTGVPLKAKSQTCMPRLAKETMEQLNRGLRQFLPRLCEEFNKWA